jgi:hypothetical protein
MRVPHRSESGTGRLLSSWHDGHSFCSPPSRVCEPWSRFWLGEPGQGDPPSPSVGWQSFSFQRLLARRGAAPCRVTRWGSRPVPAPALGVLAAIF